MKEHDDLHRFYTSWSWKREHLPDRDRFRRPYTFSFDTKELEDLHIKQAQFKSTGFASTVWDSSIVASKFLEKQAKTEVIGKRCLDLSAGCGLAALLMSRLGASEVVATDLDSNLDLLRENCEANAPGCITVQKHCWGEDLNQLPEFDLVVACDVMYVTEAVPALISTLRKVCSPQGCIILAHGRNRGGEQTFMSEVHGIFSVELLGTKDLHETYQCDDVKVYRLKKISQDIGIKRSKRGPTDTQSIGSKVRKVTPKK